MVTEIASDRECLPALCSRLVQECPAERYVFRMPVGSAGKLFGREAKRMPFGMLRDFSGDALSSGRLAEGEKSGEVPWLSFPMD